MRSLKHWAVALALVAPGSFLAVELMLPSIGRITDSAAYAQSYGTNAQGPGTGFQLQIESYFYGNPVLAVSNLSGCSTGGSPALSGDMSGGTLTAGTTASTTCTITWPVARSVAPHCAIVGRTAAAGAPVVTVESTTALTWTFTSTASTVWDIVCMGAH